MVESSQPLLLFDGVCNFCNFWVRFVIRRDPRKYFRFAPIQGPTAASILPQFGIQPNKLSSVILVENGKAYTQSSAALRIARRLRSPWKIIYVLIVIPRFIRDAIYNVFARNRYRWFGKKDSCMVPPPDWKDRFYD